MRIIVHLLFFVAGIFFSVRTVSAITISPLTLDFAQEVGEFVDSSITIFNETKSQLPLSLTVESFTPSNTAGQVRFEESQNALQKDFLKWFSFEQDLFFLQPSQTKDVSFQIKIPTNATPGDYYGAIVIQGTADTHIKKGSGVGISERVAALVFLTVQGNLSASVDLIDFSTPKKIQSFVPHEFRVVLENTGNTYIQPKGDIVVGGLFGKTIISFNHGGQRILPGTTRSFIAERVVLDSPFHTLLNLWPGLKQEVQFFGFGPYKAVIEVTLENVDHKPISQSFLVYVYPWRTVFVVFIFILALFFIRRKLRKNKFIKK